MSAPVKSQSRALVPVQIPVSLVPVTVAAPVARPSRSPLRVAVWISCTIAIGSVLATLDSPIFDDLFSGAWLSRTFAEAQQRQAGAIATLEKTVGAIGADVDFLNARADNTVRKHQAESTQRFAALNAEMEALKVKLASVEAAQDQSRKSQTSLSERVDDLTNNLFDTKSRLGGLRSSLHEQSNVQRSAIAAITKRLDRLESASHADVTASVGKPAFRKTPRSASSPQAADRASGARRADVNESTAPTNRPEWGHIFDTKPLGLQEPAPARTPAPPGV